MRFMKTTRVAWLALLLGLLAPSARADDARRPIGPSDPAELEAFLDGLLPSLMATHHAPGAVFVMVKDGLLIGEGTHAQLLERSTDYQDLVENQLLGE